MLVILLLVLFVRVSQYRHAPSFEGLLSEAHGDLGLVHLAPLGARRDHQREAVGVEPALEGGAQGEGEEVQGEKWGEAQVSQGGGPAANPGNPGDEPTRVKYSSLSLFL